MTGAALLLALSSGGMANVISFGTDAVDELHVAGVVTEGAFQYQATGLGWELVNDPERPERGNPPASLATVYNGDGPTVGDRVDFSLIGGGLFTFASVDFRTTTAAAAMDVSLTGYLGASPVGLLNLTDSSETFQTVLSGFDDPIDLLRVSLTQQGNDAMFLDNLIVTPIPEPAALLLAALALTLPARARARRRKRQGSFVRSGDGSGIL